MSVLATLGDTIKALAKETRIPFSRWGGNSYGSYGGMYGGFYDSLLSRIPDTADGLHAMVGDPLDNSVVAACVDQKGQAFGSAPAILEKKSGDAWQRIDHPISTLLSNPNGFYGAYQLWQATIGFEDTTGNAFWRMERYASTDEPYELWVENPRNMRLVPSRDKFIDGYEVQVEGQWLPLENSRVIHFRHALDPRDPRWGRAPLQSGISQIAGDNAAARYHGALLRNSAMMSLLVGLRDQEGVPPPTPQQMEAIKEKINRATRGEGAGSLVVLDLPVDVHKMAYSPDEMSLDSLISYYEARICALLSVDPMVIGLGSGTQQKTYANMAEAINDFWERTIIPAQDRHGAEIMAQMFPLFGLDRAEYRLAWDRSRVAALQENEDQKYDRNVNAYRFGLLDKDEARVAIGKASVQEYQGVFAPASAATDTTGQDGNDPMSKDNKNPMKALPSVPGDDMPEPLPDPHGVGRTDEELAALTDLDNEEAIKLALGVSTPAVRKLLAARPVADEKPKEGSE